MIPRCVIKNIWEVFLFKGLRFISHDKSHTFASIVIACDNPLFARSPKFKVAFFCLKTKNYFEEFAFLK